MRTLKKSKYFYVIQFYNGIKFGITSNIESRLSSYKKPWMINIKNIKVWPTKYAYYIEEMLRNELAEYAEDGSYEFVEALDFKTTIDCIDSLIKLYTSTPTFNKELLEEVKSEIECLKWQHMNNLGVYLSINGQIVDNDTNLPISARDFLERKLNFMDGLTREERKNTVELWD